MVYVEQGMVNIVFSIMKNKRRYVQPGQKGGVEIACSLIIGEC